MHRACSVASTVGTMRNTNGRFICILNIQIFLKSNIKNHATENVADEQAFARFDTGGFS
jgi:hypothetical protein